MEKFLKLLVLSSADPEKVSMTLKGLLLQYVGMIVLIGQFTGVSIAQTQVVDLIGYVSAFVGTGLAMIGLARKVYYYFK